MSILQPTWNQAKQEFTNWVDTINRQGHIAGKTKEKRDRRAKKLQDAFTKRFRAVTAGTYATCEKSFLEYVEKRVNRRKLTQGNKTHILDKVKRVFQPLVQPQASLAQSNVAVGKKAISDWAERQKNSHLTPGNISHIQKQLEKHFLNDSVNIENSKKNFKSWLERAQNDKHFTQGNVRFIEAQIEKAFPSAQSSSSSNSSQSQSSSSSSNNFQHTLQVIEQTAQQKGYVHFYLHGESAFLGNF